MYFSPKTARLEAEIALSKQQKINVPNVREKTAGA